MVLARFHDVGRATDQIFTHADFPTGGEEVIDVPPTLGGREFWDRWRRNMDRVDGSRRHMVGHVTKDNTVGETARQIVSE